MARSKIDIVIDVKGRAKEKLEGIGDSLRGLDQKIAGVGSRFGSLGLLGGAAAVGAVTAAVANAARETLNYADAMGKLSTRTGVSVEKLSELERGFRQADLNTKEMERTFFMLSKHGRTIESVAEEIKGLGSDAEQTNRVIELFGERLGPKLKTLLLNGAQGIEEIREKSQALGHTLNTNTARQAERFNDALDDMGSLVQGFKLNTAAGLMNMLDAISEKAKNANSDVSVLRATVEGWFPNLAKTRRGVVPEKPDDDPMLSGKWFFNEMQGIHPQLTGGLSSNARQWYRARQVEESVRKMEEQARHWQLYYQFDPSMHMIGLASSFEHPNAISDFVKRRGAQKRLQSDFNARLPGYGNQKYFEELQQHYASSDLGVATAYAAGGYLGAPMDGKSIIEASKSDPMRVTLVGIGGLDESFIAEDHDIQPIENNLSVVINTNGITDDSSLVQFIQDALNDGRLNLPRNQGR